MISSYLTGITIGTLLGCLLTLLLRPRKLVSVSAAQFELGPPEEAVLMSDSDASVSLDINYASAEEWLEEIHVDSGSIEHARNRLSHLRNVGEVQIGFEHESGPNASHQSKNETDDWLEGLRKTHEKVSEDLAQPNTQLPLIFKGNLSESSPSLGSDAKS
jgi:hypothetical protein